MTIRSAARFIPIIAALTSMAAPAAGQRAPCADALAVGEVAEQESARPIAADLTLDGATDAAYWWTDGGRIVLVIGSCDGPGVAERWRFVIELPAECPPAEIRVEPASLLVDEALLERTCVGERSASECAHLRRENERRQALMDAGSRALRIGGPSCTVETLRWSPDLRGFMRIPG